MTTVAALGGHRHGEKGDRGKGEQRKGDKRAR